MSSLTMFRGDTVVFDLNVVRSNGITAVDLTNAHLYFTGKIKTSLADSLATFKKTSTPASGIIIDAGVGGTAVITLYPSDTTSLTKATKLFYDITMKDGDGNVFTLDSGTLLVKEDITRDNP